MGKHEADSRSVPSGPMPGDACTQIDRSMPWARSSAVLAFSTLDDLPHRADLLLAHVRVIDLPPHGYSKRPSNTGSFDL